MTRRTRGTPVYRVVQEALTNPVNHREAKPRRRGGGERVARSTVALACVGPRPVLWFISSYRSNWLRARCLARTMASCRRRASYWASRPPARRAVRSSSPGSRGWWPGRCRWPPGSMYRSARSVTPNGPTSGWRSASFCRDPSGELRELAGIYEQRGLPPELASEVAAAMSRARRAGGARAGRTRPRRGATGSTSSGGVDVGAGVLGRCGAAAGGRRGDAGSGRRQRYGRRVTLLALGLLGDLGARLGGAPRRRATVRVVVWGAVAMAITAGIGALVGTVT